MKQKQCRFIKPDKTKCTSFAMNDSNYCYRHNPDIPDEDKINASSKGGKSNAEPEFIETPLPEIKIKKLDDLVCLLEDTINNMRAGKISQKFGSSFGYLSFILLMVMEKAEKQNERERIKKLKAEGKWRPEPSYGPKLYTYKDEFFLDKDGNPLIVEKDGSTFYPKLNFQPEDVEESKTKSLRSKSRSSGRSTFYPEKKFKQEKPDNSQRRKFKTKSHIIKDSLSSQSPLVNESDEEYTQETVHLLENLKEGMDMKKAEELNSS